MKKEKINSCQWVDLKDCILAEKIKIKSKDKCYAIFAAPQNNMLVSEQNPSSDLTLFIKRYKIVNDKEL